MAIGTSAFLLLFTLHLSLTSLPTPSLSSIDSYLFGGCTQRFLSSQDNPYMSNVNSLLTSLANSATYSSYNNYKVMGPGPGDALYGLYQCRGDLAMPDCATCVAQAADRLGNECSHATGGALQLDGCYVKYDNATFLSMQDKTMVLKKCGPPVEYGTGSISVRDAVLSGLQRTGGAYRAGASGQVQSVSQCVGDLSVGQCQGCLMEAIRRLKTECDMGNYGDMFLSKCYVRYSIAGATDLTRPRNGKPNLKEKAFTIIIGLLAGVALLIIVLAFVGKFMRRSGK